MQIKMIDYFHLDICSTDSKENFPNNKGNNFRVKLCESLTLSGKWEVVLTSLSIFFRGTDAANVMSGLEIDVHCNIVGLSIVGGYKTQLLRRVNIGQPTKNSHMKTVFHVKGTENYCFYKPVITQECSVIEIELKHSSLYVNDLLENCVAYVSLHLKRRL